MKVIYTSGQRAATWDDGELIGSTSLIDQLLDTMRMGRDIVVTEMGPVVLPELTTHLGAFACGVASGFSVTGDYPTEMRQSVGATCGATESDESATIAEAIGRRRDGY